MNVLPLLLSFYLLNLCSALWPFFPTMDKKLGKLDMEMPKTTTSHNGENGGVSCAACTIIISLTEQYIILNNKDVTTFIEQEACQLFPAEFQSICDYLVLTYGADVIEMIESKESPDTICHNLEICTDPTCNLWSTTPPPFGISEPTGRVYKLRSKGATTTFPPWQWLVDLFNRLGQYHKPIVDLDGDDYSVVDTLRGASWRGKDCNDGDATVHAGVLPRDSDRLEDSNCNGISGTDPKSGQPWEDVLCSGTGYLGVVVVGDSAGAHFELPPAWFNASQISEAAFANALFIIEDEVDKPYRSAYTGFEPSTPSTPIDSFYNNLFQRNRCNHRDYQNLGVNGARSGSTADNTILALNRNLTLDQPVILFLELIGNDVCDWDHKTSYTPIEEFSANIYKSLDFLNQTLPPGSKVVFIGLADGTVLWDSLWNRTHPIGATYQEVYNFLNCLYVSPCWGWMNSNETVRTMTSAWAAQLSLVYPQIIADSSANYPNFEMAYYSFAESFAQIIQEWQAQGGETWQLIEPVDGFHPNQQANALFGAYLWDRISTDYPSWIGEENPNNNLIKQVFGNQGGYW